MLWLTATAFRCARPRPSSGDAEGCERLYTELLPHRDRLIQWSFTGNGGSVRRVLGRAAAVAGRDEDACEHFEAALTRHAELEAPALLARTRCDYGRVSDKPTNPGPIASCAMRPRRRTGSG